MTDASEMVGDAASDAPPSGPEVIEDVRAITTDVAIDASGGAHVVYFTGIGWVRYAHRSPGGTWTEEEIEATGLGDPLRLVLDGAGTPHAVYLAQDGALRIVMLATRGSGDWSKTPVAVRGYAQGLALPPDGTAYVAYEDRDTSRLMLGTRASGAAGFTTSLIADVPNGLLDLAMARGGDGTLHVTFVRFQTNAVHYALGPMGGTWPVETVETNARWPSIAVGTDGTPHLADRLGDNQVRYGRRSTSWTLETAIAGTEVGWTPDLA